MSTDTEINNNGTHRVHTSNKSDDVTKLSPLKIIGKEFPQNCSKTIFRKINTEEIFFQLTLITNKDYFSRKKLNLRKFTVAVYVIYIYGCDWSLVPIVNVCKYC